MKQNYQAPETKVLEIVVEQCLARSSEDPLEDPIENPEQDW